MSPIVSLVDSSQSFSSALFTYSIKFSEPSIILSNKSMWELSKTSVPTPSGLLGANRFFALGLSQKSPILATKSSFLLGLGYGAAVQKVTQKQGRPGGGNRENHYYLPWD